MSDKSTFVVKFEVRTFVEYEVEAIDEDDAIRIATFDANIDYDHPEYYDSWEK